MGWSFHFLFVGSDVFVSFFVEQKSRRVSFLFTLAYLSLVVSLELKGAIVELF